jgi:predicted nucleic acid-binding protein
MKLYIDADVWLNFWLDETVGFIPASHYMEELLEIAFREKWILVISGAVKREIYKKHITPRDLEEKLSKFRQAGLLEEIEAEEKDIELADRIYKEKGLHRSDALHTALALKAKAIIVTRTAHFNLVKDVIKTRKPEDLLGF